MSHHANHEAEEKFWSLIKSIKVAMMTTMDEGMLRSRPMHGQYREEDDTLWFFTKLSSAKADEIRDEQEVNLSFADIDDNHFVSVSGRAALVKDRAMAEKLWNPFVAAWYPEGLDDPDLVLIRITPEQAEYWDGNSNTVKDLWETIKANVTGELPDMGENRKVYL